MVSSFAAGLSNALRHRGNPGMMPSAFALIIDGQTVPPRNAKAATMLEHVAFNLNHSLRR
jgi:hypothetical protein